jgi:hypothetical protein
VPITACDRRGLFAPHSWNDRIKSCLVVSGWEELIDHNPVVAAVSLTLAPQASPAWHRWHLHFEKLTT